jgi:all-trans-retinol dehydrogenase (NAD+)
MLEYGLHPFKKNLKGDHVFLTGAGGGIGRLIAIRMGHLGCKLSLCDIQTGLLEETKDILIKNKIPAENICTFKIDMCSLDSIKAGANTARNAFGDVSVLINNAGVVTGKYTLDLTEAEIDRTMEVNTISHLHTIREFMPAMLKNKKGHIVTIASMVGLVAGPGVSDYCASKFGAVGLDESLRCELRGQGLHN